MITNFEIVKPDPRLEGYIQRIFVLETSGKLPTDDLKLIVPNGCPKLVIPFRNGLVGKSKEWEHVSKENTVTFIGVSDIPASVDFGQAGAGGTITVEFSPVGASGFLDLDWSEVTNGIYHYTDIALQTGRELEEQLANTQDVRGKLNVVQQFLLKKFLSHAGDSIFEYCVRQIALTKGTVTVKQLERSTGYSARWLNTKFRHRIGISAKNLSSIIRFQQYYHALVTNAELFFLEKEFYNYYYDQSHFIRDFKRFTGHSPLLLARSSNDYDRVFYKG